MHFIENDILHTAGDNSCRLKMHLCHNIESFVLGAQSVGIKMIQNRYIILNCSSHYSGMAKIIVILRAFRHLSVFISSLHFSLQYLTKTKHLFRHVDLDQEKVSSSFVVNAFVNYNLYSSLHYLFVDFRCTFLISSTFSTNKRGIVTLTFTMFDSVWYCNLSQYTPYFTCS